MKLWKKLLIGVAVLAAIFIGIIGYGIFKVDKAYTEKIAPDMKRYMMMTEEEQNQYVLSRLDEFYGIISKADKPDERKAARDAIKNDAAVRQAGILMGRSLCAAVIQADQNLAAGLSAADKEKYAREAEELKENSDRLHKEMDRVLPKKP